MIFDLGIILQPTEKSLKYFKHIQIKAIHGRNIRHSTADISSSFYSCIKNTN